MNRNTIHFISFVTLLMVMFLACERTEAAISITLEIEQNEVVFWPEAGERIVDITSNVDFKMLSDEVWCKVEVTPNNKNKIRISVDKNNVVGLDRTAYVTISAGDITKNIKVIQFAAESYFDVTQKSVFINDNQTRNFSITVTSNLEYAIDIPSWINHQSIEKISNTTSKYNFIANHLTEENSEREGNIVFNVDKKKEFDNLDVSIYQSNKRSKFSAASYNIYVGRWQERKKLVYEIINSYDFDIWGTQEGTLLHLTDIKNEFSSYDYIGVGRDGEDKGEFSAIFYKTDRFELLDEGSFWFSNTPEKPSYGWDATNYRRICSWGFFRDKETQSKFYFFNSHFDHEGTVARTESSKLLLSRINSITESGFPIFLTGDLNCHPDSEPINLLLSSGFLYDSRSLTEEPPKGSEGTINRLDPNLVSTSRIDYIFVSSEVKVKQYSVINDRPNGICPSDHDPVLVNIEL